FATARAAQPEAPPRPRSIAEQVERAGKWIVAIRVERTGDLPTTAPFLDRLPAEMRSYYERPKGWVSGILLDREGRVVTSHYNVAGTVSSIEVRLPSGESFPARVVARSVADDVALLRIERPDPSLEISAEEPLWGDSAALKAGRIVFAIGRSPDPSRVTATQGIVSGLGRNGGRAIQTDAELNYGNVGGPIVDLDGRIVAIAGFVGHDRPQWGVNSGVGFGTTAAALLGMLPELERGGDYVPFRIPFLGVREDPAYTGVGARILAVVDGPAKEAGIAAGDVIVEFDGKPVESFAVLRWRIYEKRIGDKVKIKVQRRGDAVEVEAVLGALGER
ncbi:MAG: S1C family serine protease, partial [Planctomycetota bacterium]